MMAVMGILGKLEGKRRRERRKKLFWSMYADTFETQSTRIMRERERGLCTSELVYRENTSTGLAVEY